MKYAELRKIIESKERYPGTQKIPRSPVIHEGFPGAFNLSYAEKPFLDKFGTYTEFDEDFLFSTIQSCIRHQDFEHIKDKELQWRYLGVFEMADISGFIAKNQKANYERIQANIVADLVEFLGKLGIKKKDIYPSYHQGGNINEITQGKYFFNWIVPQDSISKEAFLAAGIPPNNLIRDKTRNTFLSLHLHRPTPWGFRNEINVDIGNNQQPKLLDVATIEYFCFLPTYNGEEISRNIIGVEEFNKTISISAVGVERLCQAVNRFNRVHEVDNIALFYDKQEGMIGKKDYVGGESLRALHRVYADMENLRLEKLSKRRRNLVNRLVRNVRYDKNVIKKLLKINAQAQPWHEDISLGNERLVEKIEAYHRTRTTDY